MKKGTGLFVSFNTIRKFLINLQSLIALGHDKIQSLTQGFLYRLLGSTNEFT